MEQSLLMGQRILMLKMQLLGEPVLMVEVVTLRIILSQVLLVTDFQQP